MNKSIIIPDMVQELLSTTTEGLPKLTNKLCTLLSLPVLITDPHYQILASSSPSGDLVIKTILAIQQLEQIESTPALKYQITTIDSDIWGVGSPITHENNTLGYLFIFPKDNQPTESYAPLLDFAASLGAIQLYRKLEMRQEKMKFKEAFLFDLLYGNIKQKEDIYEYGRVWDWDFHQPQTSLVFAMTDFNHVLTDKQMINTLLYIIERTLLDISIKPVTMKRQNQVIVILPMKAEQSKKHRADIETFSKNVINQIKSLYPEEKFSCGIGQTYESPVDLFRSYQEAKVALELGEILGIAIPFFTDLGVERILYKHDLQELREYYEATLGELVLYDETNNAQLMETLEGLVTNQFDMTATSQALFLHRNTLRYRLKKIEEILDLKLDDLNNKLNITAAIKIKQLRKI
ncbi:helix-turn-helix domain-containing protein [Neobacillus niacini]|uniref:PucR family transcriptional regulator n=1 Tax=Neobacillus niacini TaxID=86668 RepID=UPI002FFE3FE4